MHLRHDRRRALARTVPALVTAMAALGCVALWPAPSLATPTSALATSTPSQSPAATANNRTRATFGVQPATDGKPDGRPSLTAGVTPGSTFSDHVALMNSSLRAYTLDVYATDAVNDDG